MFFNYRIALNDLNKSTKPQKILGEEIKLIETFPEKVVFFKKKKENYFKKIKSQMESINQNLDFTYQKLKQIEEKLNSEKLMLSEFETTENIN